MKIKKLDPNVMYTLIGAMFVVTLVMMAIPLIFGDVDSMANDNNVSVGEYAEEYNAGQTLAEAIMTLFVGVDVLLAVLFVLYILSRISL